MQFAKNALRALAVARAKRNKEMTDQKRSGNYMESDGEIPQEVFNNLQDDVSNHIKVAIGHLATMLYKSKQAKSYFAYNVKTVLGDVCVVIRKSKVDPDVMCPCCSAIKRVDWNKEKSKL